jgi:hypothetical protein
MNRFTNRRLTELEKLVAVSDEPEPRIWPWTTPKEAMEIWTRALNEHNRRPPAFTAKEKREAKAKVDRMTREEIETWYERTNREIEEKIRREHEEWERAKAAGMTQEEFMALHEAKR